MSWSPPTPHLSDGDLEYPRSSHSLVAELALGPVGHVLFCRLIPFTEFLPQEHTVSRFERTLALVFSPAPSVFPTSQVPATMRSLRLLRTPFLCGLLWAFCAPGARAEEPGASFSHPSSVGLDKNTVHDQEYVFSQGWGPRASHPQLQPVASCDGSLHPAFLPLFVPLDIFQERYLVLRATCKSGSLFSIIV